MSAYYHFPNQRYCHAITWPDLSQRSCVDQIGYYNAITWPDLSQRSCVDQIGYYNAITWPDLSQRSCVDQIGYYNAITWPDLSQRSCVDQIGYHNAITWPDLSQRSCVDEIGCWRSFDCRWNVAFTCRFWFLYSPGGGAEDPVPEARTQLLWSFWVSILSYILVVTAAANINIFECLKYIVCNVVLIIIMVIRIRTETTGI